MDRPRFLTTAAAALAATAVPRFTTAAGPVTVKIGFLDSFTGVFSDVAGSHRVGAELALADLNRPGRVRFELVRATTAPSPPWPCTEARRLMSQEHSMRSSAARPRPAAWRWGAVDDLGIFNLTIGPFDSSTHRRKALR